MNGLKSNQNSCRFRFLICFGFWPSHQVDLTRLDQQSWKRELEEEAKAKKAEGGNGGDESDPPKRKGKKPGRPKAKATPKRAAKCKPKGKATKTSDQPGGESGEVPAKVPKRRVAKAKESKCVSEVPKPCKRAKVLPSAASEDLATPPPSRADCGTGAASSEKGDPPAKAKKTFARRYRPTSADGARLWDAIRAAFVAIVAARVKAPSKLEVGGEKLLFFFGRFRQYPIIEGRS